MGKEKDLVAMILEKRAKGLAVSTEWVLLQAKKMRGGVEVKYGDSWACRFRKRNNLTLRAVTHKRPLPMSERVKILATWHKKLREFLAAGSNTVDPKWGRYIPMDRYNVDQVPLPFVSGRKRTWDPLGSQKRVTVTTHDQHSEKRFATLQLCISPDGVQLPACIIFRGTLRQHISDSITMERIKFVLY